MVFEAGNASVLSRISPAVHKLWKSRFRRPRPTYTAPNEANEEFELKQLNKPPFTKPFKDYTSFTFPRGVNTQTESKIIT